MNYRSLKTLFESRAARHPERLAAWCGHQKITFDQLNRRANQIARALRRRGVGTDVLVGVYMNRSLEMLAGLLGIVKAGGAYLPLDPGYPPNRLSYIIKDSRVGFVLCAGPADDWRKSLGVDNGVEVLDLRAPDGWPGAGSDAGIETESEADLNLDGDVNQLVYVIYTSGSTGQPKGVLGTELGMLNRLHWMWERFPFRTDEIGCVKTSLSFLDSFWEIFGHLLQGVPVALVPDVVVKDTAAFVQSLQAARVTRLVVVPSLLRTMLSNTPDIGTRLRQLTLWVSSGEALSPEVARRFREMLPSARLLNLYGASEVSADCAWYDVGESAPEDVAIGHPIPNNDIHILDEGLRPVPVGVTGEIFVAGVGLARGYLGRAALTAERFLANPFGPPGSRLYRTGDIGRRRPEGILDYVGRADQQVKIRGFRVELGEIEAALRSHPAVSQSVMIAREDGSRPKQILGYVVPADGQSVSGSDLRSYLAERLPDYMVPAAILPLSALPLTPTGKLDRNALPAPDFSSHSRPPQTPTEQLLADLFAEVLELEQVGVEDKFFDLGGDSLSSVDLATRARDAGLSITPLAVLQHQTVKALAAAEAASGKAAPPPPGPVAASAEPA